MAQPDALIRDYMEAGGLTIDLIRSTAIPGIPISVQPNSGIYLDTPKGQAWKAALELYFQENSLTLPVDSNPTSTPPGSTQQGGTQVKTLGDYMNKHGITDVGAARDLLGKRTATPTTFLMVTDIERMDAARTCSPAPAKRSAASQSAASGRTADEVAAEIQAFVATADPDIMGRQKPNTPYTWLPEFTRRASKRGRGGADQTEYEDPFGGWIAIDTEEYLELYASKGKFPMLTKEHSSQLHSLFVELLMHYESFSKLSDKDRTGLATKRMYQLLEGGMTLDAIRQDASIPTKQQRSEDAAARMDELRRKAQAGLIEDERDTSATTAPEGFGRTPSPRRRVTNVKPDPNKVIKEALLNGGFSDALSDLLCDELVDLDQIIGDLDPNAVLTRVLTELVKELFEEA